MVSLGSVSGRVVLFLTVDFQSCTVSTMAALTVVSFNLQYTLFLLQSVNDIEHMARVVTPKNLMYGSCRLMVLSIFVGNVMPHPWPIESKKVNLTKLSSIPCSGNFIVDDSVPGTSFLDHPAVLILLSKSWQLCPFKGRCKTGATDIPVDKLGRC